MNKKGGMPRTILWPIYILLAFLIGYVLYSFINNATSNEGFERKYFLNDLGLTLDTLSSANHDLTITYNIQNNYDISIATDNLKLGNEALIYHYVQDNNINFNNEFSLEKNSKLLIKKSGNTISIDIQKPVETTIT